MAQQRSPASNEQVPRGISPVAAAPSVDEELRRYGPEVLGFLVVLLQDPVAARDVHAQFCEDFWRGYAAFRGDSSVRTWAYVLARHAAMRWWRSQPRAPLERLSNWPDLAQPQPTITAPWLATTVQGQLQHFRAQLHPDDQAMLTLRLDRDLGWSEVAQVLLGEGEHDGQTIARKAAALRKRFERLKDELRRALAPLVADGAR